MILNPQTVSSKPLTSNSLERFRSKERGKSNITTGMTPKEISEVVSEHLIGVVKQQFGKK